MLGRALAIDFGERRVGLAICDPEGRVAVPLATVERSTDRRLAARLSRVAAREQVRCFVLGDPVLPDGRIGPAAERVRRFAHRLAHRSGLPVALVQEPLTSREASRRQAVEAHPEGEDAVAAQLILEEAIQRARDGAP